MTDTDTKTPDVAINVNHEQGTITIAVRGFGPITIDPMRDLPDLMLPAALHGFKQKYGDAAALGKGSTLQDKYDAIRAVVDHHKGGGAWNRVAEGTGSGDGLLVAVLVRATGCDRDAARERVKALDAKAIAYLLQRDPDLAPHVAAEKAERAARKPTPAPTIDTGALLAGLKAKA